MALYSYGLGFERTSYRIRRLVIARTCFGDISACEQYDAYYNAQYNADYSVNPTP